MGFMFIGNGERIRTVVVTIESSDILYETRILLNASTSFSDFYKFEHGLNIVYDKIQSCVERGMAFTAYICDYEWFTDDKEPEDITLFNDYGEKIEKEVNYDYTWKATPINKQCVDYIVFEPDDEYTPNRPIVLRKDANGKMLSECLL